MGHLNDARKAFSDIYDSNAWGRGSGVGSEPQHTVEYVALLRRFLVEHRITSVVDFGCGDWQFSRLIDWSGVEYDGFDVVAGVIAENTSRFAAANVRFHTIGDGTRLPTADLLICKDVLQHLPNADIRHDLAIFKRLYPHMLITNDIFPEAGANSDIDPGQWRPLKLDQPPFNQRFEVALRWDVIAYGCHWTKQTCHVRGEVSGRPPFVTLRDSKRPHGATAEAALRAASKAVKGAIFSAPLIGSAAQRARALFTRERP